MTINLNDWTLSEIFLSLHSVSNGTSYKNTLKNLKIHLCVRFHIQKSHTFEFVFVSLKFDRDENVQSQFCIVYLNCQFPSDRRKQNAFDECLFLFFRICSFLFRVKQKKKRFLKITRLRF